MKSGIQPMIAIKEIFYTIQGESTFAGFPCSFVRTAGCPLRCRYCDTTYAFHGGRPMSVKAILDALQGYPTRLVEITGGEPMVQEHVPYLADRLLKAGFHVLLETSGAMDLQAVPSRVVKIVDIKCPDSGEFPSFVFPNLQWLMPWDQLKFVVMTDRDVRWSFDVIRAFHLHEHWPVLVSPAYGIYDPVRLARFIQASGLSVRLQIQLHKVIGLPEGIPSRFEDGLKTPSHDLRQPHHPAITAQE